MNLDIGLLADAATVDASGKLNVLGVFHRLRGPEFPLRHARLALVLRFAPEGGEEGRKAVGIRLVGPEDELVLRLDGQVDVQSGGDEMDVRIPQVLNLDGIVFPARGTYRFLVDVDGEEVGEIPLKVEEGRPPRGAPRPGAGGPAPIVVPPGSEGGVRA
jgi:hypothetical protein